VKDHLSSQGVGAAIKASWRLDFAALLLSIMDFSYQKYSLLLS